jgi:hypothetical protein
MWSEFGAKKGRSRMLLNLDLGPSARTPGLKSETWATRLPQVKWRNRITGLELLFSVHIVKSAIDVEIEYNGSIQNELDELYIKATNLARACVDTLSFAKGWTLSVYLDRFVEDSGRERGPFCSRMSYSAQGQNVSNEQCLRVKYLRYKPIAVPFDVEDRILSHSVRRREHLTNVCQRFPGCSVRNPIPNVQRDIQAVSVCLCCFQ